MNRRKRNRLKFIEAKIEGLNLKVNEYKRLNKPIPWELLEQRADLVVEGKAIMAEDTCMRIEA